MISNYIVSIIIVYSLFKDYDNKSGAKEKTNQTSFKSFRQV